MLVRDSHTNAQVLAQAQRISILSSRAPVEIRSGCLVPAANIGPRAAGSRRANENQDPISRASFQENEEVIHLTIENLRESYRGVHAWTVFAAQNF